MARTFRPESQPPTFTLTKGAKLAAVLLPDGGRYEVASCGITSIAVQMENGNMAPVPWARVRCEDGRVTLVNLAHAECVVFADRLPVMPDEDEEGVIRD